MNKNTPNEKKEKKNPNTSMNRMKRNRIAMNVEWEKEKKLHTKIYEYWI